MRTAILTAILLLAGCAGSSAGMVTSNVPVEGQAYTVLGPAETVVSWWSFDVAVIAYPLGEPPISEAVSNLLKQKEGDALVNLRYATDRTIILFMTRHRFHLKADVIKFDSSAPPARDDKAKVPARQP
jgi:hypothetical protein